jgi:hypothetical protein
VVSLVWGYRKDPELIISHLPLHVFSLSFLQIYFLSCIPDSILGVNIHAVIGAGGFVAILVSPLILYYAQGLLSYPISIPPFSFCPQRPDFSLKILICGWDRI